MKSLNMTLDATMKQLNERHVCVGINDGFKRQVGFQFQVLKKRSKV